MNCVQTLIQFLELILKFNYFFFFFFWQKSADMSIISPNLQRAIIGANVKISNLEGWQVNIFYQVACTGKSCCTKRMTKRNISLFSLLFLYYTISLESHSKPLYSCPLWSYGDLNINTLSEALHTHSGVFRHSV